MRDHIAANVPESLPIGVLGRSDDFDRQIGVPIAIEDFLDAGVIRYANHARQRHGSIINARKDTLARDQRERSVRDGGLKHGHARIFKFSGDVIRIAHRAEYLSITG